MTDPRAAIPGREHLTRYWIEFDWEYDPERFGAPDSWLRAANCFGFGATAFSQDDAVGLLRQRLFDPAGVPLPPTRRVEWGVRIESLPPYVRFGFGGSSWRGVWWPPVDPFGFDARRWAPSARRRCANATRRP